MTTRNLAQLLIESARRSPTREAVGVPEGRTMNYGELDALSDRLRDRLWRLGVRRGDRVGLRLHKSIDGVATIFGILKTGACYVPVDAESPAARGAYSFNECQVKVVVTDRALHSELEENLQRLNASPAMLILDHDKRDAALAVALDDWDRRDPTMPVATVETGGDDLAYILYT